MLLPLIMHITPLIRLIYLQIMQQNQKQFFFFFVQ